jgi:hypothetical protein
MVSPIASKIDNGAFDGPGEINIILPIEYEKDLISQHSHSLNTQSSNDNISRL